MSANILDKLSRILCQKVVRKCTMHAPGLKIRK